MPSSAKIVHLKRNRRSQGHVSLIGKWITWVIGLTLLTLLGLAFFTGLLYVQLVKDLPPVGNIEMLFTETWSGFLEPIQVYDRSNIKLIDLLHPVARNRQWLHIGDAGVDAQTKALLDSIVFSHDRTFWSNKGYDLRPLLSTIVGSGVKGEKLDLPRSITQRLIQMTILPSSDFLHADLWRYLREAILAQRLTERYSKSQILEWYINSVGFGNLTYGVDAASLVYFDKHAPSLTLAECAILAAISKDPTINPFDIPGKIQEGQASNLQGMLEEGLITDSQFQSAYQDTPIFREESPSQETEFQHVVLKGVIETLGSSITDRAGLLVFTTIDSKLQKLVRCTVEAMTSKWSDPASDTTEWLSEIEGCSVSGMLPNLGLEDNKDTGPGELASMILDAQNGGLLGFYGPIDRPVPSTTVLYPFVYLSAFSRGSSPGTMVLDVPLDFLDGVRFEGVISNGPVLMRTALAGGYPFAAQRIVHSIGLENVLHVMEQMGLPGIGLDGGSSQDLTFPEAYKVSLVDTAYSYTILANSGKMTGTRRTHNSEQAWRFLDPIFIREVRDELGKILYQVDRGERFIVSQELAFLVTDVLKDSVTKLTVPGQSNLFELDRPLAVMSGSDRDGDMGWTIGYTPSRVVGVWLEDPSEASAENSIETLGSSVLWQALMKFVTQAQPPEDWQQPGGILQVEICEPSGLLPTRNCPSIAEEYFIQGTQPVYYDTFYKPFQINKETGKLATLFTPQDLVVERVFFVPPPEASEWARDAGYLQPPEEYDMFRVSPSEGGTVKIDIPLEFDYLRGRKWVSGQAHVDGFRYFRLQYGEGLNPTYWYQIGENQDTPVVEGTLTLWDTTTLAGLYALQLIVVDQEGIAHIDTKYVTVDNERPSVELLCTDADGVIHLEDGLLFSCDVHVSDNTGVSKVEFYLNERRIGIDFMEPFTLQIQVEALKEGLLSAWAYDLAGNVSQSEGVQITIVE